MGKRLWASNQDTSGVLSLIHNDSSRGKEVVSYTGAEICTVCVLRIICSGIWYQVCIYVDATTCDFVYKRVRCSFRSAGLCRTRQTRSSTLCAHCLVFGLDIASMFFLTHPAPLVVVAIASPTKKTYSLHGIPEAFPRPEQNASCTV